jgi:hypothetical protein
VTIPATYFPKTATYLSIPATYLIADLRQQYKYRRLSHIYGMLFSSAAYGSEAFLGVT